MTDIGLFVKQSYQEPGKRSRYEYLLTDMGRDLYGPFVVMLRWGDRWLSGGKPPLMLKHVTCGHDFHAVVICDQCRQPISAAEMRYKLTYDPKAFGALGPRSVS